MFMSAMKLIVVLDCVAVGTLLLGGAEAQQVPVKAPRTPYELYVTAKMGNTAALRQLKTLAGAGDTNAQFSLGAMYENGEGVPKDVAQAVSWYRRAAEQGVASAQNNLGAMYYRGDGVPKDAAQAVSWFRKAAEQGNAHAQFSLGAAYESGEGVPKDAAEAVSWYRKAAEQGDSGAQSNLGAMYYRGDGVPKDLVIAYVWRNLAAAQGSETAKKARDSLESSMTPAQIAEAQKLSREWKPKK